MFNKLIARILGKRYYVQNDWRNNHSDTYQVIDSMTGYLIADIWVGYAEAKKAKKIANELKDKLNKGEIKMDDQSLHPYQWWRGL